MTSSAQQGTQTRFFIALLPPRDVQAYAETVIQELGQRYQSGTSKSSPHITLQPPFQWSFSGFPSLESHLAEFADQHTPIPIQLDGFGAFAPCVLYINVVRTSELLAQQAALSKGLGVELGIVDPQAKNRPFVPHLTVASRNLTRQTFHQAWADLQPRSVQFEFVVDRLSLMVYQAQRWQIQTEFPLKNL